MDHKTRTPMTPFDQLVTSPQLQAAKLLLPYLPASSRQLMAACIKWIELRQTLFLFRTELYSSRLHETQLQPSFRELLNELSPYLPSGMSETMEMFLNLKEMMDLTEFMQTGSDGNHEAVNSSGFDLSDMLMGMLSPEQQELFQTYSAMFQETAGQEEEKQKGDDENGRMDQSSCHEEYGSGQTGTDPDSSGSDKREGRT